MLVIAFKFTTKSIAKEENKEEFKPVFIRVTIIHRSSDSDVDYIDW